MDRLRAVAFNVFGTLVKPLSSPDPLKTLLELGRQQGRPVTPADQRALLTRSLDIRAAAEHFGLRLGVQTLRELEQAASDRLGEITPYEDTEPALLALKHAGYRIGLCANLPLPLAGAIDCLPFPPDHVCWSFSEGMVKPAPEIYRRLCEGLEVAPEALLMVGQQWKEDVVGPRQLGITTLHLDRSGKLNSEDALHSLSELVARLAGPRH